MAFLGKLSRSLQNVAIKANSLVTPPKMKLAKYSLLGGGGLALIIEVL